MVLQIQLKNTTWNSALHKRENKKAKRVPVTQLEVLLVFSGSVLSQAERACTHSTYTVTSGTVFTKHPVALIIRIYKRQQKKKKTQTHCEYRSCKERLTDLGQSPGQKDTDQNRQTEHDRDGALFGPRGRWAHCRWGERERNRENWNWERERKMKIERVYSLEGNVVRGWLYLRWLRDNGKQQDLGEKPQCQEW